MTAKVATRNQGVKNHLLKLKDMDWVVPPPSNSGNEGLYIGIP